MTYIYHYCAAYPHPKGLAYIDGIMKVESPITDIRDLDEPRRQILKAAKAPKTIRPGNLTITSLTLIHTQYAPQAED